MSKRDSTRPVRWRVRFARYTVYEGREVVPLSVCTALSDCLARAANPPPPYYTPSPLCEHEVLQRHFDRMWEQRFKKRSRLQDILHSEGLSMHQLPDEV